MPVPGCNGEMVETLAVTEAGNTAAADDGGSGAVALEMNGCAGIDVGTPTSPISSITSKNIARPNIVIDAT